MKRHVLGQLEDIEDGTIQARDVGGRNVVIARHGDRIFALRYVCPHQGAKLSNGVMSCSRKNARVGDALIEACKYIPGLDPVPLDG